MEILQTLKFKKKKKKMASLSNRVSSFFLINNSLKWWLFQCFFRPFTISPSHNLKEEKKRKKERKNDPTPNPTRDSNFSGWVGFLLDKPHCYQFRLDLISVLDKHRRKKRAQLQLWALFSLFVRSGPVQSSFWDRDPNQNF